MVMTVSKILTALIDNMIEGLARFGWGTIGVAYPFIENDHESK
jgi:hypothetical protein